MSPGPLITGPGFGARPGGRRGGLGPASRHAQGGEVREDAEDAEGAHGSHTHTHTHARTHTHTRTLRREGRCAKMRRTRRARMTRTTSVCSLLIPRDSSDINTCHRILYIYVYIYIYSH